MSRWSRIAWMRSFSPPGTGSWGPGDRRPPVSIPCTCHPPSLLYQHQFPGEFGPIRGRGPVLADIGALGWDWASVPASVPSVLVPPSARPSIAGTKCPAFSAEHCTPPVRPDHPSSSSPPHGSFQTDTELPPSPVGRLRWCRQHRAGVGERGTAPRGSSSI